MLRIQRFVSGEFVIFALSGRIETENLTQLEALITAENTGARSRHDLPLPPLSAVAERVTFPFEIWRLVDVRWKELGYRNSIMKNQEVQGGQQADTTSRCRRSESTRAFCL